MPVRIAPLQMSEIFDISVFDSRPNCRRCCELPASRATRMLAADPDGRSGSATPAKSRARRTQVGLWSGARKAARLEMVIGPRVVVGVWINIGNIGQRISAVPVNTGAIEITRLSGINRNASAVNSICVIRTINGRGWVCGAARQGCGGQNQSKCFHSSVLVSIVKFDRPMNCGACRFRRYVALSMLYVCGYQMFAALPGFWRHLAKPVRATAQFTTPPETNG